MQASTVDTPTTGYCGTIFVAIELSQKSWLITLHSPDVDRISRHKLEGGDHAALLALIEKTRTTVTDDKGEYKIIELRPGTYTVSFTLPGFNTFKDFSSASEPRLFTTTS